MFSLEYMFSCLPPLYHFHRKIKILYAFQNLACQGQIATKTFVTFWTFFLSPFIDCHKRTVGHEQAVTCFSDNDTLTFIYPCEVYDGICIPLFPWSLPENETGRIKCSTEGVVDQKSRGCKPYKMNCPLYLLFPWGKLLWRYFVTDTWTPPPSLVWYTKCSTICSLMSLGNYQLHLYILKNTWISFTLF